MPVLSAFLGSKLALYIGAGMLVFFGLGLGWFEVRIILLQNDLKDAIAARAIAESHLSMLQSEIAMERADQAAQRAKEVQAAADEAAKRAATVRALEGRLRLSETRRVAETNELKRSLQNEQSMALSPVLRLLADGVRDQQSSAARGDAPARPN